MDLDSPVSDPGGDMVSFNNPLSPNANKASKSRYIQPGPGMILNRKP